MATHPDAREADRFTVSTDIVGSKLLAEVGTAQEAAAAAVRQLPAGLGPVTFG